MSAIQAGSYWLLKQNVPLLTLLNISATNLSNAEISKKMSFLSNVQISKMMSFPVATILWINCHFDRILITSGYVFLVTSGFWFKCTFINTRVSACSSCLCCFFFFLFWSSFAHHKRSKDRGRIIFILVMTFPFGLTLTGFYTFWLVTT